MRSDERGSGTVMMGTAVIVLSLFTAIALIIGAGWDARQKLVGAADMVALSGANAYAASADPCQAAAQAAAQNDVSLESCETVGDSLSFAVSVKVSHDWLFGVSFDATSVAGKL
ncbi:MAG: flp pilus-assembly TadE/G-like family protein [Propionibacteriaceae bacterium]|jgi:secretion/DNA translocation related TadE-like protein|nr:flp pilus-assembly TadE/G-like family protein [Propionibacteriaceae bacterium]